MEMTRQQEEARKLLYAAIREGAMEFVLFGYAGTGKTTLIKFLVEAANGHVVVLALTNKAVRVLRDKGIDNAETIHRFLYPRVGQGICNCRGEDEEFVEFHAKTCPAIKPVFGTDPLMGEDVIVPSLIIVDECSMVPEKIARDILDKGIPVLAVGDPFQLPPVEGKPYWTKPDYELTDIQRQAKDNPIIRLAHDVRMGRGLKAGRYGGTVVDARSLLRAGPDMEDWDQVLTFRHVTRCAYNGMYRKAMGFGDPYPMPGETIMMRSTHKTLGLANGDMFTVESTKTYGGSVELRLQVPDEKPLAVAVWGLGFGDAEDWSKLTRMDFNMVKRFGRATFGYVITTHSAQGSEWDRVLIAKDNNRSPNWMYTALTRARERAYVCLGAD